VGTTPWRCGFGVMSKRKRPPNNGSESQIACFIGSRRGPDDWQERKERPVHGVSWPSRKKVEAYPRGVLNGIKESPASEGGGGRLFR